MTDIDQIKFFLNNWNKPPVIAHNIRVIGLRRSGNHAIINWLLKQVSAKTIFFNDLNPGLKQLRRGKDTMYFTKLRDIFKHNSFKDTIIHSKI